MSETGAKKDKTLLSSEETIVQMVDARAAKYGDRTIMQSKQDGSWVDVTWSRLAGAYRDVARGLLQLGLGHGDSIAILSENRPEWAFADLGIYATKGVVVPLYWTLTPSQIRYILKDSAAKAVFVSNADFLDRILQIRSELPDLAAIIVFDQIPSRTLPEGVMYLEDLVALGCDAPPEVWESMGRSIAGGRKNDFATLIYTSGTTGEPKGVVLTHDNFLSNVRGVLAVIDVGETDSCLSFLPLSHVFERIALYLFLYAGGLIHYAESIETVVDNMSEVHPTILVSVPRIYEKAFGRILDRVRESALPRRMIFAACLKIGAKVSQRLQAGQPVEGFLARGHRIADKLVFSKLRETFGGRIRLMISGGAPLNKHIAEFFHAAGLLILEGYGLTETSPVISANFVDSLKFGTVGHTIPEVEVKIVEDGEILARGPNIMVGYYNRPEDTAEAIDADGWFYTGDIGHIDDDGFLVITDRKKSLIVTAGGKNVAPAAIENALSADKFIDQAFAYGDARKFISALIVPDWERVEKYAGEHKIKFSTHAQLCNHPVINALIQRRVDKALEEFAPFERVKKFKLMEQEFSQEDGEVTPTLKLKRKEITRRYWKELDSLYEK
ncbi:MAG: long-chain fatty acid--CoA ligase [bacterium]|nr:long-chain fatty acid--CoA ligase [bacterium]MDT8365208.1 long-chain fatty acid--CoA ligase [bacterium]